MTSVVDKKVSAIPNNEGYELFRLWYRSKIEKGSAKIKTEAKIASILRRYNLTRAEYSEWIK